MTRADDPDDGGSLGYATREGPMPKLVVVAIVWVVFGVVGLFSALLLHSSGFAIFGALCFVAGGALYFAQRTRDQLAYDEVHLRNNPWSPPSDDPVDVDDEPPAADGDTRAYGSYHGDDDILDAEFTEYFDYDQSPADQDDGTGYDDEEVAYQRHQADQRARDAEDSAAGDEVIGADEERDPGNGDDDEHDDVARTSRIPTGDDEHGAAGHEGSDHEGSGGRRR
jgi:hypothetical protein